MNTPLDSQIEALLFWKGEPISKRELTRIFGVNMVATNDALRDLSGKLEGRGISLIEKENEVSLVTAPSVAHLIEQYHTDELGKDIGKAAQETLAIIVYRGGASRREIEYIRGVNSSSIIRTLLIRGLIERAINHTDERVYIYKPTIELQAMLGVGALADLPQWKEVKAELDEFEAQETERTERAADIGRESEKDNLAE